MTSVHAMIRFRVSDDRFNGLIGFEANLFVFDGMPEALNDHVVSPTAFAVHDDLDSMGLQEISEFQASELTTLIGIHDLWYPMFLNRLG